MSAWNQICRLPKTDYKPIAFKVVGEKKELTGIFSGDSFHTKRTMFWIDKIAAFQENGVWQTVALPPLQTPLKFRLKNSTVVRGGYFGVTGAFFTPQTCFSISKIADWQIWDDEEGGAL